MKQKVTIYTDGACSGNPGPGGWAALLIYKEMRKVISGGDKITTNNRMELIAAIEGLKILQKPCEVLLYTDSKYVQDGANLWMKKWQENNWRRGSNLVKNQDLWQSLAKEMLIHDVKFMWVKGHSGHPENDLVDSIARNACMEYKV